MKRIVLVGTMLVVVALMVALTATRGVWAEKGDPLVLEPRGLPIPTPNPYIQRLLDVGEAWWSDEACPQIVESPLGYRAVKTLWEVSDVPRGDPRLCYYYASVFGTVRDAKSGVPLEGVKVTTLAGFECPGDCEASWATKEAEGPFPAGFYQLGPLFPGGYYIISFAKDGYRPLTIAFPLLWGLDYKYDVFLILK